MVSASMPGTDAISSSRSKARFVSSMAVTCTRALAAAMCSPGASVWYIVRAEAVHPALAQRRVAAAGGDGGRLLGRVDLGHVHVPHPPPHHPRDPPPLAP